jgi:phytoene synthase
MSPDEYCREKAIPPGSDLYYAMLYVPGPKRRAAIALHAFHRELNGIIEADHDPAVAGQRLAWWRSEIQALYGGRPQHPVSRALAAALGEPPLPQDRFQEPIEALHKDLDTPAYADFETLSRHCRRVSGVLWQSWAEILGHTRQATLHAARDLGVGLQLTQILWELRRDLHRGHLYLPLDELERFGVSRAQLEGAHATAGIRPLLAHQAARATALLQRGLEGIPAPDRAAQLGPIVMARLQQEALREMERDGFRVLEHRIALPPLRKLWLAWRSAARERRGRAPRHRKAV